MKYWIDAVRFTAVMTIITAIIILTSACQDKQEVSSPEVSKSEESISFYNPDYDPAKEERSSAPTTSISSNWILSGIDKEANVGEVDECIQSFLDSTDLDGQEALVEVGELCP